MASPGRLHPSFAPLSPLWTSHKMAALHAIGLPMPHRSHFEAMEVIEDADPGSSARVGWLNRMVGALAEDGNIFAGTEIGSNVVPTSLVGSATWPPRWPRSSRTRDRPPTG